ncbi:MAG: hypothetical protein RLZZ214_4231, partial [Verrucomicrobiota bacterium]
VQGIDYTVIQDVTANVVRLQIGGLNADRAAVEALGGLTAAPAIFTDDVLPGTPASVTAGTITRVFYDGPLYQGNPTRVCAFIGIPAGASAANPVPAVVLAHGGGGRPYSEWVQKWMQRGYAAIAMGLEGQTEVAATQNQIDAGQSVGAWLKHAMPGPARDGIYGDSSALIRDQWMYHATADVILANSLMRSLPQVNPSKVGVMGVSWGGVVASTAIGLDNRFAFAIPTYGGGHKFDIPNQYGTALANNDLYRQVWDPILRIDDATMPVMWFTWPGEMNFSLDSFAHTYRAAGGPRMVSHVPGMMHSHPAAWNRPEDYDFADSVVLSGQPWCVVTSSTRTGNQVQVVFDSDKPLLGASLLHTVDAGHTGLRNWLTDPVASLVEGPPGVWTASAVLPSDTTAWFINVSARSSDLDANANGLSDNFGYTGDLLVAGSDYQETKGLLVNPSGPLLIRHPSNLPSSSAALDLGYLGSSSLEITAISISGESNLGSFSHSWSLPRALTTQLPARQPFVIQFNNDTANLSGNQQATGTLTFTWRDPADNSTGQVIVPMTAELAAPASTAGYDFAKVFPQSESWTSSGPRATISNVYDPADASSWALAFPETDVFAFSLKGHSSELGDYTLRVGKGGQIFSIRVNGQEWMAPQYRSGATPNRAPWMDEVFQPIALNRTLDTTENPYFIHGAGIYLDDPAYSAKPFYSPMLASRIDAADSRLNTVNWAQHAHVPTAYRSGLIHFQRITDRGAGIIEIEEVFQNAGTETLDWFNIPWMGVRLSSLPKHYIYAGGSRIDRSAALFSDPQVTPLSTTDGYAAFTATDANDSPCLALVFGNTAPSGPAGFIDGTPDWRDGAAGTSIPNPLPAVDTSWRNLRVGTARYPVVLESGASMHTRYFLVIGTESSARTRIATHSLVARSGVTKLAYSASTPGVVKPWYATLNETPLRPTENAGPSQQSWFTTTSVPVAGWSPLLVLDNVSQSAPPPPVDVPVAEDPLADGLIAGQSTGGVNGAVRWTTTQKQGIGQTFTLSEETVLDKLYLQCTNSWRKISTGDHKLRLWIGAWSGNGPASTGVSYDINSASFEWFAGWHALDIPGLKLPAGLYAFQLIWTSEGSSHDLIFARATAGTGTYTGGGWLTKAFTGDPTVPFSTAATDANDAVFFLTGTPAESFVLTDNFYQFAHPSGPPADGFWKPYNGRTARWQLLGFVPSSAAAITGGMLPSPVSSRIVAGNTIKGAFTRTIYTGLSAADALQTSSAQDQNGLILRHRVPTGWSYQIEQSSNLGGWSPYGAGSIGTNTLTEMPLPPPVAPPHRVFYRLRYDIPDSP